MYLLLIMSTTSDDLPCLLGDSILKRLFSEYGSCFSSSSREFCVSGQTIADLKKLIKLKRKDISSNVVVIMIGTNNILRGTPLSILKNPFRSLIRLLTRLHVPIMAFELIPFARFDLASEQNSVVQE